MDPLFTNIEEYFDPIPYLGYRFEKKSRDLKSSGKLMDEEERELRLRCKRFLVVLLAQLKQRLPDNIRILKSASLLSVDNSLKPIKNSIVGLMELMDETDEGIVVAEEQFRKLCLINWSNKTNSYKFWDEVVKYKDGHGANPFH